MATIHKNFNVDLQSHHIVCNPTDRSRGFTMGGETPTVILTVRRNTPAEKSGLQNGDYILQIGPKSVHMLNSEGVEKVLAGMSTKGFEITVAHVSPWPRNLTEKKYAISKIKRLWEERQKIKWGPLQVDKHPGQGEGERTDALSPPTESGVSISRWNEGADVDFSAEFDSDEEPPPSDEDEVDDGSQQAIQEWMELFKDGKKMAVVKGKVKGKVAPKREQDWANVQKSHAKQTAAPPPVSPGRRLIPGSKEVSQGASFPGVQVQVKERKQISPLRHIAPPSHDTPPQHDTPPSRDTPHHDTPPHHGTPPHRGTPPKQDLSPHHVPGKRHHSPSHMQPNRDTPTPVHPPSSKSPTTAGGPRSTLQPQMLSPWQQEASPKHQTASKFASGPVTEKKPGIPHTTGNSHVSPSRDTSTASTDHSHGASHHKVTPEKATTRRIGRPVMNIPPPPSGDRRPLVRVLRKEDVDEVHQSSQPAGRHITATSAAKRSSPEPSLSTGQQNGSREGGVVRVSTQPSPQKGVSVGHPQLRGVTGASYQELAGLRQTQQEVAVRVTKPSLCCSEPEFATLGLPFPVATWTTADVCQWLKQLNPQLYNSYMPAFYKYRMTGKHLMQVSKRALQRLGASSAEHLDLLWRSIEELKEYEEGLGIPDLDEGNEVTFL